MMIVLLGPVAAGKGTQGGWDAAQDQLAGLSTNSVHRTLENVEHAMFTEDRATAAQSAQAIRDVVNAVRSGTPVAGEEG